MKDLRNPKSEIRQLAAGRDALSNFNGAADNNAVMDVQFSFQVTNAGVAKKVATLCPGLHTTNAEIVTSGITSDGILDDSEFVSLFLTGASQDDQLTIKHFLAFLKEYRFLVEGITLQTNNSEQYDEKIFITPSNPFENEGRKTIAINKYFSEYQPNETKITMRLAQYKEQFEMSNLNVVTMPFAKSSVGYITLHGKAIIRQ